MITRLINAFEEIKGMGYYKNESAKSGGSQSGHENAVCEILVRHTGMSVTDGNDLRLINKHFKNKTKIVKTNNSQQISEWIKDIANNTIIRQPCGKQRFPDFLVKISENLYFMLECKSVDDSSAPMWNEGKPSIEDCVYIFSRNCGNYTTFSLGKDLANSSVLNFFNECDEDLKKLIEQKKQKAKNLGIDNWFYNARSQFCQKEWLKDSTKEKNVLEFIKQCLTTAS